MKKEKALGSIPTFENVERKTETLDLFKEDKKETSQKTEKELLKEQLKKEIENEKENYKKNKKEKTIEELEEELKESEKHINKIQENLADADEKETENTNKIASTQRAVRKGYIRQTFVVSKENLELIRALTSFLNTKQVDLLEALINEGLKVFSEEDKEQALKQYRKTLEAEDNTLSKYFN